MKFVTYAQNFEDVVLFRALRDVIDGFYIDVGAMDPEVASVTKAFYDRGWRGINIEPIPRWYQRLVEQRPRDINCNVACGADENSRILLYDVPGTGSATADAVRAVGYRARGETFSEQVVPSTRLDALLRTLGHPSEIHFLKIDVEGSEREVLQGMDFTQVRPWIVLIESTLPWSHVEVHEQWENLLLTRGYSFVYFDGINRFYVSEDHLDLSPRIALPPNILDDFIPISEVRVVESLAKVNAEVDRAQRERLSMVRSFRESQQRFEEMLDDLLARTSALESTLAAVEHDRVIETAVLSLLRPWQDVAGVALTLHVSSLEAQLADSRDAQTRLSERLQGLEDLLVRERSSMQEAQARFETIVRSTSWRATAPMRSAADLMKHLRGKILRNIMSFVASHAVIRRLAGRLLRSKPALYSKAQRLIAAPPPPPTSHATGTGLGRATNSVLEKLRR